MFAVIEATYTDDGGTGGANPLTGRAIDQLQPKRKQAEHFTATGRVPGGMGSGDPGVQRETTADTAGGFQNIGFIEDGDWWSFAPVNLTGIDASCASGSPQRRTGGVIEVRTGAADGPLRLTANVPRHRRLADVHRRTVDLPAPSTTHRSAVLRRPQPRRHRWWRPVQRELDRLPRPRRDRQRAAGGDRVGEPDHGHRAARRGVHRLPPPTPRATPR